MQFCVELTDGGTVSDEPIEVVAMGKKSLHLDHIPAMKVTKKIKRSPFIVTDIEAALHDDVHVPCGGVLSG